MGTTVFAGFFEWNDFPDCTQLSNTNTCVLWSWELAATGQEGQTAPSALVGRLALCISPCTAGRSILGSPTLQLDAWETSSGDNAWHEPQHQHAKTSPQTPGPLLDKQMGQFPCSAGSSLCNTYALALIWVARLVSAFLYFFFFSVIALCS